MMEVAIRMLLGAIFLWLGGGVIDYRYDLLGWRRRFFDILGMCIAGPRLGAFFLPVCHDYRYQENYCENNHSPHSDKVYSQSGFPACAGRKRKAGNRPQCYTRLSTP
jgi:hypothetical protein